MSEAGREPSRANARSITRIEEIASAYLTEAGGDLATALGQAIQDALADLAEIERRAHRAEWLISRGFVRGRSVVTRRADQGPSALCLLGEGASAATRDGLSLVDASSFLGGRACQRPHPSARCWESASRAAHTYPALFRAIILSPLPARARMRCA